MNADKQRWETTYPNRRWEEHWRMSLWRWSMIERDIHNSGQVLQCLMRRTMKRPIRL
jgi:hypothetical protein